MAIIGLSVPHDLLYLQKIEKFKQEMRFKRFYLCNSFGVADYKYERMWQSHSK